MIRHQALLRFVAVPLAACLLVACSGDDGDRDGATGGSSTSTADATTEEADAAVAEARLLPGSGPVQAGTYASAAFDPLATFTVGRGWTVSSHSQGSVFLSYEDDPGSAEVSGVGISRVTGVYDTPFLTADQVRNPVEQQSHVRPLPDGDLVAALDALPGTTIRGREEVEIAGVRGTRFTLEVADLPEAKEACPDGPPRGCFWTFDVPGLFGNLVSPGDAVEMTAFSIDESVYVASVSTPPDGPVPAGFEQAARTLLQSLEFGAQVELDQDGVLELFLAGLADSSARGFALAVTAQGSPARAAMAVLEADAARLAATGGPPAVAERTDNGDGSVTVTFEGIPALTFDDFEFEGGLVRDYTANDIPIGERAAAFDDGVVIEVGPLTLEGIGTYRAPSNDVLWVTFEVRNGSEPVDVSGVSAVHVAPDGTEIATSTPLDGLVVPPFWSLPFTFQFPEAPSEGQLVIGGTIGGQPVSAELELPPPVG